MNIEKIHHVAYPCMHVFLDAGMGNVLAFFELPNQPGHRVELACPDPEEEAMIARANAVKWQMLEEWSHTKRAPKHAAFLHAAVPHPDSGGGDAHHA
jgi:hypothetical protein